MRYLKATIHLFVFLFTLTAVVSTPGHAQAQQQMTPSNDELKADINSIYTEFTELIKSKKPEKLAEKLYTEDARFYPPNGGEVKGRAAITQAMTGLIQSGIIIAPEAMEVEKHGDIVYEYGVATMSTRDGKEVGKQRYVVIWKMENGRWKMYRDFVKGAVMQ